MMTVVVFEEDVLRLICANAPQNERSLEEKQSFYDKLKCQLDMHSAGDLMMRLADINGHIGRHIDGFDGIHGGNGVGHRNLKGRMLSVLCLAKELCVSNTWFLIERKRGR